MLGHSQSNITPIAIIPQTDDIDNVENVSHHMAEQSVLASDFASDSTPERSITAGRHKTQKRGPKAANVSNVPMDDTIDDDSDDDAACGATLRDMTPGKGQKLAYQRYRKLKDKLKTHVSRPVSLPMAPVFRSSETTEPTPKEFRVPTWDELDGGCPAASAASAASTARITRSCAASASAIIDLSNGDDGSNYDILSRGPTDDGPQLFGGTSSAPVAPPASRSSLQQLFDDENYTMQVKVKWCSAPIETLPLRRHQPFVDLCKVFAGRLADAAPEHIVLMLNERILRHDETPDAVDLTIGKVISECGQFLSVVLQGVLVSPPIEFWMFFSIQWTVFSIWMRFRCIHIWLTQIRCMFIKY